MFNYRNHCRPCTQTLVFTTTTNSVLSSGEQKRILNQSRVPSSLYLQERSAMEYFNEVKDQDRFEVDPPKNESVKHGSYARFLQKKKNIVIRKNVMKFKDHSENFKTDPAPLYGNKFQPRVISSYTLRHEDCSA